jgi:hypothetical protein
MRRKSILLGALLLVLCMAQPAQAQAQESYGKQFGWGMAAIGANLFYIPGKLVYAALGGFTGSMGYLLSAGNFEAAQKIWSPTVGGTYVLTPSMLRGEEPIFFAGESHESPPR